MTDLQKQTVKTIVNIFETGKITGNYSAVTVLPGDSGHVSYGRSQASLGSGTLLTLLKEYCERSDARFAAALNGFLPRVARKDFMLDNDPAFRMTLIQAGHDPAMRATQDDVFDRGFFSPACTAAMAMGVVSPLGQAVVYDSFVQGGWLRIKAQLPTLTSAGGESHWIPRYLATRRDWLASSPAPLPATVYRVDAFTRLIAANNWGLVLPIDVHGTTIPANLPVPNPLPKAA